MKVQFHNVYGLAGKAEEVWQFAGEHGTDIVVLVETWMDEADSPPI